MKSSVRGAILAVLLLGVSASAHSQTDSGWISVGPRGGDVRSFAVDPKTSDRVYLGTAGGALYRSDTAGHTWRRLSPGFPRRNQNLDELVVSPLGTLLVGFWDVRARGGGVATSTDLGETFSFALEGESVRALRLAPSDPRIVVAGSLTGVFASDDGGATWRRITPLGHDELRNVESVAIDPRDPRTIYVGTWHLPWKTTDGGITWRSIPRGMIDDSDVFTLTLDRRNPDRVHATACSGIYGSPDGAGRWSRVRGMPFGSRRARAFAQDLERPRTFYAGTTEGLWLSTDDTASFRPVTSLDVVVNALATLPGGAVLAGTDGAGVLRSEDHGRTWVPSNEGFSERFISRIVFDPASSRVLGGVWGDRIHGGVFSAPEARGDWTRLGAGLKGREVLSLAVAGARIFAGTDRGLFALDGEESVWFPIPLGVAAGAAQPRINDLSSARGRVVLAATSTGLFRSEDGGRGWSSDVDSRGEVTAVVLAEEGETSAAATGHGIEISSDEGRTWTRIGTFGPTRVNALTVVSGASPLILAATTQGLYRSANRGATWSRGGRGLPDSDYTGLAVTPGGEAIFVSDFIWGGIYRSDDLGLNWRPAREDGLVTDQVWSLGIDPVAPHDLLAGSPVGGLHLLRWK